MTSNTLMCVSILALATSMAAAGAALGQTPTTTTGPQAAVAPPPADSVAWQVNEKRPDGVRGTFDQLYPTNHAKYGTIDLVGYKNLHEARAGATVKSHPRLTLDADFHSFWLAHRKDGLYDASGNLVARIAAGAPDASRDFVDTFVTYTF